MDKATNMIRPAKKTIVVTPKEVKRGGIIEVTTDKAQETGVVVAIGEGKLPIEVSIGEMIAYRRYGESLYYLGGKPYMFIDFKDILGVIEEGGDK